MGFADVFGYYAKAGRIRKALPGSKDCGFAIFCVVNRYAENQIPKFSEPCKPEFE